MQMNWKANKGKRDFHKFYPEKNALDIKGISRKWRKENENSKWFFKFKTLCGSKSVVKNRAQKT